MERKIIIKPDFIQIPYQLIDDRELEQIDRLLYGLIYWFEHLKDGSCTAGNGLLAELLHTTTRVIQNSLNTLESNGYIEREYKDAAKRNRLFIRSKIAYKYASSIGDRRNAERPMGDTRERPMGDQNKNKGKRINTLATQDVAGGEVNEVIDLFQEVNPSYTRLFANKTQRAAVERLLKVHGREKLVGIVRFLPKSNTSQYAPTITTPHELETNFGRLIAWGQRQKSRQPAAVTL